MTEITQVPITEIKPGNNDRKSFDRAALAELAQSIDEHGLAQPITVRRIWECSSCGRRDPDFPEWCDDCQNDTFSAFYEIVAGERRFRAISEILGWDTIPAIVRDLSNEAASAVMLAENTSRADLNPIEEANAYQSRITRFDWSVSNIAKAAGVNTSLVKRRLALLALVPEIQHLVGNGHFPIGHAEAMACLDSNRQRIAARIFRESTGIPLKTFRGIVNQLLEEQSQDNLFDLENFWIKQVQQEANLPKRGKKAVVGAPVCRDLPPVKLLLKASASAIIDNYIVCLQQSGHEREAAAIGTVYTALVHGNFMSVPMQSALLAV